MKYLVIGDIMIDRYVMGDVMKISPEAPVPIVEHKVQYDILGGAANCARNIVSLEAHPGCVDIIGYLGDDSDGNTALRLLQDDGVNFKGWVTSQKPTILKERIFAGNQQLLRLDVEDRSPMMFDRYLFLEIDLESYDYILVSDYAKGVVSREMMDYISHYKDKILIDPKPENWACYPPGVFMVTPNQYEYAQLRWRDPEMPQHILVTKGKCGMTLYTYATVFGESEIKGEEVEKCEVIGAGDTVIASIAVTLANTGLSVKKCCEVANRCAQYAVSQPGTAAVPISVYNDIMLEFI